MTLHELLDLHYCANGDETLRRRLGDGDDPNLRHGPRAETPLHVATRRRRAYRKRLLEDATPRVRDVLHRELA